MSALFIPSPLPGLSNRNHRIDTPTGVYVLRLARPDGSGYVDRAQELAVTAAMSDLGIGAPFVAGDAAGGWLITGFVGGAEPLTGERLISDPVALAGVVAGIRRLQGAPVRFDRVFDPFETIKDYLDKLARATNGLTVDPALLAALPIAAAWVAAEVPTGDRDAARSSTDIRLPLAAPPSAEITDPILLDVLATLLAERAAEGVAGSSALEPGPISGVRPDRAAAPVPSTAISPPDQTLAVTRDQARGPAMGSAGDGTRPEVPWDQPYAPDFSQAAVELPTEPAPHQTPPTSLSLPPSFLVPAHGDPTPANLLFDGIGVTLIDWEYAAMAHPLWDFAGLAVEAALPREAELAMLAMAGARPTRGYVGLKFAALMVSGLWAALRDESGEPDHAIRRLRDERLSLAAVLADKILAA